MILMIFAASVARNDRSPVTTGDTVVPCVRRLIFHRAKVNPIAALDLFESSYSHIPSATDNLFVALEHISKTNCHIAFIYAAR